MIALLACLGMLASNENAATQLERGRRAWTEYFSDDGNLKTYLRGEFTATDGSDWENVHQFKERFSISDERLRIAVMSLYEEAVTPRQDTSSQQGFSLKDLLEHNALLWLGSCADTKVKSFLRDLAGDSSQADIIRIIAVASYLRAADEREAKDALMRFLVSESRMDSQARSSIIEDARLAYIEAGQEKKRAIIESLYVALANEDAKWLFRVYDDILSRLSQQYADSRQRRYILEMLINATPTCLADELALSDLKTRLDKLQKVKPTTDINTNLVTLNSRDFSQSPPGGDAVAVAAEATTEPTTTTRVSGVTLRVLGSLLLLALVAIGMWCLMRTREPRH